MENFIKKLTISNFKSVKKASINCKRINIFIGRPNSGKSNILEAITLLGGNYDHGFRKFLHKEVRYESLLNLFHYGISSEPIEISTNLGFCILRHFPSLNQFDYLRAKGQKELIAAKTNMAERWSNSQMRWKNIIDKQKHKTTTILPATLAYFDSNGTMPSNQEFNADMHILKYVFESLQKTDGNFSSFLLPSGENIFSMMHSIPSVRDFAGKFFEEYQLNFVMKNKDKSFEIQRKVGSVYYDIPFSLTPDTLQRVLYHLAAIDSNANRILIFEEPEAHSFPEYIQFIADKIISSSGNQFFIATHSPYLLNTFLDSKAVQKDLAIFITDFSNYQTRIKKLTEKEVSQIHNYGTDIFYNLQSYFK